MKKAMERRIGRYLLTGLCGALLCVLASCGVSGEDPTAAGEVPRPEAPQKTELVIGAIQESQELTSAVSAFNMASDSWHVSVRVYMDDGGEISYQDAAVNAVKELVSGVNCPDLLDLSGLDARQLAAKGVLEDLTPYLEEGGGLQREDFLEHLLDAYTYSDVLVGIPPRFSISTLVGRTSEVGVERGWTLEELLALAESHPDAAMFADLDKNGFVYDYMLYNPDAFIDWESGESHFDSGEFRQLLEFANTLPEELDNSVYNRAFAEEKQAGEILLQTANDLYDFYKIQLYPAMFGEEVTYIGFPTGDGSVGCTMQAKGPLLGIAGKSRNKDGAWAFLETYLAESADSGFAAWGFPCTRDKLQEAVDKLYLRDENGERLSDENGDPIPFMEDYTVGYEDWEYTCHAPTDEEIRLMLELLAEAKPHDSGNQIRLIVLEEADAYFKGQKTPEEVMDILQNRVGLYMQENR